MTTRSFPLVGLLTLSALVFTTVTSEFLPTGLLPDIAAELNVSLSQVGFLVTVFAAAVVLTAAPLAVLTRRFSRKSLVMVVMCVFIVGNVMAALAPNYQVLLVARVIGGVTHGLFWSVVGAYGAHLVAKEQLGRAVAIVSAGGSAAFVLGVPVGTAIGHAVGWRLAFGIIAATIAVLTVAAAFLLPPVEHREVLRTGEIPLPLRKDRTIPAILLICVIATVAGLGQNIFYTYIAPYLISEGGFAPAAVAGVLFLHGGAGAIGLVLSGILTDRYPRSAPVIAMVAVCLALVAIGFGHDTQWVALIAIAFWGMSFGAIPSMLQTRMLRTASVRMRDLSSAYFTTSFNIAIGAGALIGGILVAQIGLQVLPFVDLGVTLVALVVVLLGNGWLARREASPGATSSIALVEPPG